MRIIGKFIVLLIFLPGIANALNVETHKAINERVGNIETQDGFTLNQYLIDNLDFGNGVEEIILDSQKGINQKVSFWLRDGGLYEDKPPWAIPYRRSFNHYHNPLTEQGYRGSWMSSIQWAMLPLETQSPEAITHGMT